MRKPTLVSIPSNGSSLFQSRMLGMVSLKLISKSQSPQTGQVYFNRKMTTTQMEKMVSRLNPLKRVKFISMKGQTSDEVFEKV